MDPQNNVERRYMRVKMLFDQQSDRFRCFFNWLIAITTVTIIVVSALLIRNTDGKHVYCSPDGAYWRFQYCGASFTLKFLHVVTTMQCAAMARKVFGRTVRQVSNDQLYERLLSKEASEERSDYSYGSYSDSTQELDLDEFRGDSSFVKKPE